MNRRKKISLSTLIIALRGIVGQTLAWGLPSTEENNFPFILPQDVEMGTQRVASENLGEMMATEVLAANTETEHSKGFLDYFLGIFGFNDAEEYTIAENGKIPKALIYIKSVINVLLSLVSLISLIVLIYSFYQMYFADGGEDKVKKNVKGLIIALVGLGLSRLIVSFIFYFYESNILS